MTDKEKLAITTKALQNYARLDLWFHGDGHPIRGKERYGGKDLKYNCLGVFPAQDGWEMAQEALAKIGK